MKLRKTGRIAIAGLAVVATLGLTACGTDDKKDPPKTSTSAPVTSAPGTGGPTNPNLPPVPTVAQLNELLQRALDPSVPSSEKLDLVEGIQADPDLPNRMAEAYKQAGAKADIISVTAFGDALSADAKFTINGQENPVVVPFVAEAGKWKVQKAWACQALTALGQTSPACS